MMEHKAYLLDYVRFETELRPILERALSTADQTELAHFVNRSLHDFRDPYVGESLNSNWETKLEVMDSHQYGDFALTKYYDPKMDIGLGAEWQEVESLVLGLPIGPKNNAFDPGKMGSYFQSADLVRRNFSNVSKISTASPHSLNRAARMLEQAVHAGSGLYVTF